MNYVEMFDLKNGIAIGDAVTYNPFPNLFFANENVGYSFGDEIKKTNDGGISWTSLSKPTDYYSSGKVSIVNENEFFVANSNTIFKTVNGGYSWSTLFPTTTQINKMTFVNKNLGCVMDFFSVVITSDGGQTWKKHTLPPPKSMKNFYLLNENVAWYFTQDLISKKYEIYGTTNGGLEWKLLNEYPNENLNSIYFSDQNNGLLITTVTVQKTDSEGYTSYPTETFIYRTSDGGKTWIKKKIADKYFSLVYIEPIVSQTSVGYIIYLKSYDSLLTSEDNGNNWNEIALTIPSANVRVFNRDTIYSYTPGSISKTNDRGKTWIKVHEGKDGSALILKTSDGGLTWTSMNDQFIGGVSGDTWRRMDFVDIDNGFFYVSGTVNPKMYRTSSSGVTWVETNSKSFTEVLKFYDEKFGFVTDTKVMFRTIDGGITWKSIISDYKGRGNDFEFLPGHPSKIYFTDNQATYYSADSGKTWINTLIFGGRDICFTDVNNGWLLGDQGILYKTENNGGHATEITNDTVTPTEFRLLQNYPNPFNPATAIGYQISVVDPSTDGRSSAEVHVTLKIYDVLGREVATLVDENKSPGTYEVKFDASPHRAMLST